MKSKESYQQTFALVVQMAQCLRKWKMAPTLQLNPKSDGTSLIWTCIAFSEHFQNLATPSSNPVFDAKYENQVALDKLLIEFIALQQNEAFEPVTLKVINTIIKSFKANKAQDPFGISAEHLKHAPQFVPHILSSLMNRILQNGYIPSSLKQGILTPVLKRKRDAALPTNYRGITVLSILGKVLEKV